MNSTRLWASKFFLTPPLPRLVFAPEPGRQRASDTESSRYAAPRYLLRRYRAAVRCCVPIGSSPLQGGGRRRYRLRAAQNRSQDNHALASTNTPARQLQSLHPSDHRQNGIAPSATEPGSYHAPTGQDPESSAIQPLLHGLLVLLRPCVLTRAVEQLARTPPRTGCVVLRWCACVV